MHQIFLGCGFFAAPVFSVSEQGVFLDCTHRVRWNGVPDHSVLRGIPIAPCSLPPDTFAAVLRQKDNLRVQAVSLPSFPCDLVAGHGVGRVPECSCPAGFTS